MDRHIKVTVSWEWPLYPNCILTFFFFLTVKYICHENNIHESIFIGYIYLFWLGLMLLTLPARTNVWEMYSCIHIWSPLMSINIICSSNQITPIPSFLLSLCFVLKVSLSTKTCICINAELKRIVNDGDVRRDIELRESVQVRPRPTALIIIHSFFWLKLNGFLTLKRQGQPLDHPAMSTKLCLIQNASHLKFAKPSLGLCVFKGVLFYPPKDA